MSAQAVQDAVRKGNTQSDATRGGIVWLCLTVTVAAFITGFSHSSWAAGFTFWIVTMILVSIASTDRHISAFYAVGMGLLWAYWGWGVAEWLGPTVGTILVLLLFGFGSTLGWFGTIGTRDIGDGETDVEGIDVVQNAIIQLLGLSFSVYLYVWGFNWPTW